MKGTKPAAIVAGTITTVPRAPKWLLREARAEWQRVLPDLIERRILSPADLGLVEDLCVQRGRIRDLERAIAADPTNGTLIRLQTAAIVAARQIAAEIGATPVSRSRPTVRDNANADDLSFLDS